MKSAEKASLFAEGVPVEPVATPEWESMPKLHVRKLGGVAMNVVQQLIERFEREHADRAVAENGRMTDVEFVYKLFVVFVCDAQGESIFTDDDLPKVMELMFVPVNRCVDAGLAFNHMTEEAAKDLRGKSKGVRRGKHG